MGFLLPAPPRDPVLHQGHPRPDAAAPPERPVPPAGCVGGHGEAQGLQGLEVRGPWGLTRQIIFVEL